MKKKLYSLLFMALCFILILSGCAKTYEQQIQQRINEYVDTMYLVFWGNGYQDADLPKKLVSTRNVFNENYLDRLHKCIFITDSFSALNLTEENIETFSEMMERGFCIYFYDYNKSVITSFVQKFRISTNNLSDGSNYFFRLRSDEGMQIGSYEYSAINENPISEQVVLTTILERMTH